MKYVSTRGEAPILPFDDVVLAGLASDGGLYVPRDWPGFTAAELKAMAGLGYAELAARVMAPFTSPDLDEDELCELAVLAYLGFDHPDVAPLRRLSANEWLLELFHGPTLAFKDYALQFLGRLFDLVLTRRGSRVTIIGATSGDTGSAAIEACRDRAAIEIFILHPEGRVSDVQRRQMTTVRSANVHNVAIRGTFDDCQDLVKGMFNDPPFRDRHHLAAVNSINWARIVAQVVYYVYAALALGAGQRSIGFSVPTGNFGNVFAGYVARRIGVPIHSLIIGSNRNDILTRFFATGRMQKSEVLPTLSPSMDIQVSSNFERLLFDLYDRDAASVGQMMSEFQNGQFAVDDARWHRARSLFRAASFTDDETTAVIRVVHEETGILLDPHTAVGVAAARAFPSEPAVPVVCVGTAHPAKFPAAVEAATGVRPQLPDRLADLLLREEHYVVLPADLAQVEGHVAATLSERAAMS